MKVNFEDMIVAETILLEVLGGINCLLFFGMAQTTYKHGIQQLF
jgi:hypothetical protein